MNQLFTALPVCFISGNYHERSIIDNSVQHTAAFVSRTQEL